jgi:multisubunit Na+/H+ antiporter MnhG subunit
MGMDIRVPLGAMFTLLGALLTAFGLFGNKAIYRQTLGIDVNLDWGIVLLIFGVIMLFLGLRSGLKDEVISEGGTEEPPPIRH